MKKSNLLKVTSLRKNELTTVDGGSVDPDALCEYIEERYGKGSAHNFSR